MNLFSIWFYLLALVYSAAAIPLLSLSVMLCRPFIGPRRAWRMFRRCISIYGRGIVSVLPFPYVRVRYADLSGGGEKGPFVYVCNHRSASDPFLMGFLPGEGVQVVNTWPFRLPVLGWFARRAGYLSIREMPFSEFMSRAARLLEDGVFIVGFPEGTRSASRRLGQFHGALFRVGFKCRATVVPVCIMGNEDKPRRGTLKLYPGEVRVHRLPGLTYESYQHLKPFEFKNQVRGIIARHIRETEGENDETDQGPQHSLPAA